MKNYYEEYKKFKEEQRKMNPNSNPHWDGWFILYLAYKLEGEK